MSEPEPLSDDRLARRTWSDVYRELRDEGVSEDHAMARADVVRIELEKRLAARAVSPDLTGALEGVAPSPAPVPEGLEAAAIVRDCIYGLRHQPEHDREVIATLLERDVLPLLAAPIAPAVSPDLAGAAQAALDAWYAGLVHADDDGFIEPEWWDPINETHNRLLATLDRDRAVSSDLTGALRDYFRAVDDIRDAGEARMGDPVLIRAMYDDAGRRKAEAEKVLRAASKPVPGGETPEEQSHE